MKRKKTSRCDLRSAVVGALLVVLGTGVANGTLGATAPTLNRDALVQTSRTTALLLQSPNRFPQIRPQPQNLLPATGVALNGLTYSIARQMAPLPASSAGGTVTTNQNNNLVMCKTTPVSIAKDFAGPLFMGSGTSANANVIYPGALFRDSDIVRGQFTPVTPQRSPGNLDINVQNSGGAVSVPVSNFNNRTEVMNAINALRNQTASAPTPADLFYTEFAVSASQELSLGIESSMDIDLGPSLQMPIQTPFRDLGATAGTDLNAGINTSNSQNFAVGLIDQTFYTISVGGEGPASTVQDDIGANVLAITDVQYGRMAFVIVASVASSINARAVAHELVSVSNPLVATAQEAQLSAAAQAAFRANFVYVKIIGGSASTAVRVNDLATLRTYVQQIQPSVAGSYAVPIRYTLRYARDNSTAFVRVAAAFNDRECARAAQLRATLKSIVPTRVVDFGDEELYGTVAVATGAGVTAVDGRTLLNVPASSPMQGMQGRTITINGGERLFNLNPLDGPSPSSVTLDVSIKDKIMGEEYPGTTDFGRRNGYVNYSPQSFSQNLQAVRDAPGSKLSRSINLTENGQSATVRLNFEFTLLPVF